jgi:hypothetical protein
MAAHTWELDRDLYLARYRSDNAEIARLEGVLVAARTVCDHVPNPEHVERCYKCGIQVPAKGPGIVRARERINPVTGEITRTG